MAATHSITPEHRRFSIRLPRPLWFGLAAVVVVVAAIGLHVGLPIYRQQVAIREIKRLGGDVYTRPRGSKWLRDRVGHDRMKLIENVVEVYLNGTEATDDTLRQLPNLPCLENLALGNTHVTDAGLANLEHLRALKYLSLNETHVTDAGLSHLKRLAHLQSLDLDRTDVSDSGLENLQPLIKLETLNLHTIHVSDSGVAELQRAMPRLVIRRPPAVTWPAP
jgi:hypothetical protein